MKLRQSHRKQAKIKMALQGSAGAGKTMSALLLAKGLTNNKLQKVAIIDTENGSADLYSHIGNYNVLTLQQPFSPEQYIKAIDICLSGGMEVIIIDSISHCWDFLLDYHSKLGGNSFTNWNKITPRQKAFVDKILQSPVHVIATMRTKQNYILDYKDGKFIPKKMGVKAIQRAGIEYEFTTVFSINSKHFSDVIKDRTELFSGKPEFIINSATGKRILDWCNEPLKNEITTRIKKCITVDELMKLYNNNPSSQNIYKEQYQKKKLELEKLTISNRPRLNGIRTMTD
ncbi:AAA family ATPase [Tenacibaculum maritimum]|uniref:AAA family ATPase n=1 Tax=Tenacibaculum maritimum TaxID=107401 RepID=UPI001E62DC1C|nr:AAA family ATPase [Tenacibaculum maritimum]MCD9584775.1 ATP-binding protein [Tenacibaculum maritimum]MCD9621611.1 ATP-binding protein [Tenacibaculum maritimum]MCD9626822.1 ATP-binding protein [Tenacibaculum maritimum]MCD9630480.1 ATP-binding protein [Tenacibaculum maritimum]MCD9634299.1 ATP-binding protein [Tenacibaculum maritimum]